jgi:hypothetical protein
VLHVPRAFAKNPLHQQLGQVRRYCIYVYQGRFHSLVIFGPEGIGKTFIVEQVARSFGVPFDLQRPGTVLGLKYLLIGGTVVLVLDDCDWVGRDRDGLNAYNMAFDNDKTRPRIISHTTGGKSIPPTEIKRGVIQITNLDFWNPEKFSLNIRPVLSRPLLAGLTFDSLDCYEFTCGLITEEGMLRRPIKIPGQRDYIVPLAAVNEVLAHIAANGNRYPSVTPRMIRIITELRAGTDYHQWLDDVEGLMLKTPRVFKNAAGQEVWPLFRYQIEGQRPVPPKRPSPPREPTEEEVAEVRREAPSSPSGAVQGVTDEMTDAGELAAA